MLEGEGGEGSCGEKDDAKQADVGCAGLTDGAVSRHLLDRSTMCGRPGILPLRAGGVHPSPSSRRWLITAHGTPARLAATVRAAVTGAARLRASRPPSPTCGGSRKRDGALDSRLCRPRHPPTRKAMWAGRARRAASGTRRLPPPRTRRAVASATTRWTAVHIDGTSGQLCRPLHADRSDGWRCWGPNHWA